MIPAFDRAGQLPAGVHEAEWADVVERFGWTKRPRTLLAGLAQALRLLRAAGCAAVYLGGSFVTAKPMPADFEEADGGRSFAEFFQFSRDDEPVGIVLLINLQTVP